MLELIRRLLEPHRERIGQFLFYVGAGMAAGTIATYSLMGGCN